MKIDIFIFRNKEEGLYLKGANKLMWCKLISANLTFDKDHNHYKLWYVLLTEDGNVTIDADEIHLYLSNGLEYEEAIATTLILPDVVKGFNVHDDEFAHYNVVVFDGVTPVEKAIVPLAAHYGYDKPCWEITWNTDIDFKKDCYKSKEECARWNRCLVREEDGTEHWVEGACYHLRLNEAQEKALKQFEKACDKMKEAGVGIIIGAYGGGVFVVNRTGKFGVCYNEPDWSVEDDGDWTEVDLDRVHNSKPVNDIIIDSFGSDDDALWV
jgi:hypothetical protein